MGADRDEIRACLGVVVAWQANGTAMVDVGIVGHWVGFGSASSINITHLPRGDNVAIAFGGYRASGGSDASVDVGGI